MSHVGLPYLAKVRIEMEGNTVIKNYNLVMPGDVDVKASDRIFEASTGKYYEIEAIGEGRKMDGATYYKSLSLLHRE